MIAVERRTLKVKKDLPPLINGDHLDQKTFHERYEAMPDVRAELIGGIVYMPSPLSTNHGETDFDVTAWLGFYKAMTPGCLGGSNTTSYILDDCPQPDVNLRIAPECGGRSYIEDKYVAGSPEMLTEVCLSSESIDLNQKRDLYEEAKVQEYLVVIVKRKQIRWHRLVRGKYRLLAPDADGIYRSHVFPGLWLDEAALFKGDMAKVLATLQEGIASDPHQRFVEDLARRKRKLKS